MTDTNDNSRGAINYSSFRQILLCYGLVLILTVLTVFSAHAQEPGQQAISNIELEYTYSDGGAVVLKIDDGILGYRWTAGPSAGYKVSDRIYQSRKIGDEIYLVNWHDSENKDYVVLVIDLSEMLVHGSALAAYNTADPFAFFDKAEIVRVARSEK